MPGLNGLRALAVIAVVWHHSHPGFAHIPMTSRGFLGVDVFFVLSGFLITTLLLRELAEFGAITLKQFYMRRTLRIFPLYYALLAVFSIYFLVRHDSSQSVSFFGSLPYYATYTSNWIRSENMLNITWSLSAEEQFYLLWPPLLVLLGRRSVSLLLVFLVVNEAVNFGLLDGFLRHLGLPYGNYSMLQATFAPIALGVLLAFALDAHGEQLKRLLTPAFAFGALAVMLITVNTPQDIRGWPRLTFHVAVALLLAVIVLRPNMLLTRGLEWRPLSYVGTISYGVYLLHMIGIGVVIHVLGRFQRGLPEVLSSREVIFIFSLAISLCMAAISFRYFESPLLRLKNKFRGRVMQSAIAEQRI